MASIDEGRSKTIETLVEDIERVLTTPHILSELSLEKFGFGSSIRLRHQLLQEEREPYLRLSQIGTKCDRQLQFKMNPDVTGEDLNAATRLKFLYGDLIEALVLLLAREAGHLVEGEQDELSINGTCGHRDCVIDGVLVDVKSASSRSFAKFKAHLRPEDDSFGYLGQLGCYLAASQHDPLVSTKDHAGFLVVDKQFGHICLDIHHFSNLETYERLVRDKQALLYDKTRLAPRGFFDEPDGASGNRKLGTACSYCAFKRTCWPGLQTYLYSTGPRFLTRVAREPKVPRAPNL